MNGSSAKVINPFSYLKRKKKNAFVSPRNLINKNYMREKKKTYASWFLLATIMKCFNVQELEHSKIHPCNESHSLASASTKTCKNLGWS